MKSLVLSGEAGESFLDWLYEDVAAALRRFMKRASKSLQSLRELWPSS